MHPLLATLATLRRRAWRLLVLFAVATLVAGTLGAVLLLGTTDAALRSDDAGLRWMYSLAVVAIVSLLVARYVAPALKRRLSDLELARRIERRFPELRDQVASAVDFLSREPGDPFAGSLELRRRVIQQTTERLEELPWQDIIEVRPVRKILASSAGVLLLVLTTVLVAPTSSWIAVQRLAQPWGGPDWPRRHTLELPDLPERVARGQSLSYTVRDAQGRLPESLRVEYRFPDTPDEPAEVEQIRVGRNEESISLRRASVSRTLELRVSGGDDRTMPWRHVEAVEPPKVDAIELTVRSPDYSGLPQYKALGRELRVLEGSVLRIEGRGSKPLAEAWARFEGGDDASATIGQDDKQAFSLELPITASGALWVELVDTEGFCNTPDSQWQIVTLVDEPPGVVIDSPEPNLTVSPQAMVPVAVTVREDLAIERVTMRFQIQRQSSPADPEPPTERILYERPADMPLPEPASLGQGGAGERLELRETWDLAEITPALQSGDELLLSVVATDAKPQEGASPLVRLVIVAPERLVDRIASRQSGILAEVDRLLKLEVQARERVNDVLIQLEEVGRIEESQARQLQGAEVTQRQVEQGLTDPDVGLVAMIASIRADLERNRLTATETLARLDAMAETISALGESPLPDIGGRLARGAKSAESLVARPDDKTAASELREELVVVERGQQVVIDKLRSLLGDLSRWDDARRFRQELEQIQADQRAVAEEAAAAVAATLGRPLSDLPADTQANLRRLARRQQQLGEALSRWTRRAQEHSETPESQSAASGESLGDAAAEANARNLAGRMGSAADKIEQNRLGQAAGQAEQLAEELEDVLETLERRRVSDPAERVAELRAAEEQLESLRRRQQQVREEMDRAAAQPESESRDRQLERLQREAEKLAEETERLGRKLERLQAEKAGQSLARGGSKMSQSAGESSPSEASDLAEQAEDDLAQAQQELAEARQQAESELAFEQLVKIKDQLTALADRQGSVGEDARRLDAARDTDGQLPDAEQQTLRTLGLTQQLLADETSELTKKLTEAEVFRLVLEGAETEMNRAAEAFEAGESGTEAQAAAERAASRLTQLVEALSQDKPPMEDGEQGPQQGPGENEQEPPSDGIPAIAQLKMLKMLQDELNARTAALDSRAGSGGLSDEQAREYARLSREQGQLAELVERLAQPPEDEGIDLDDLPQE
jgi:membrane protein implicated in regulation of membrane protease activity